MHTLFNCIGQLAFLYLERPLKQGQRISGRADTQIGLAHRREQFEMHGRVLELKRFSSLDATLQKLFRCDFFTFGFSGIGAAKYVDQELHGLSGFVSFATRHITL